MVAGWGNSSFRPRAEMGLLVDAGVVEARALCYAKTGSAEARLVMAGPPVSHMPRPFVLYQGPFSGQLCPCNATAPPALAPSVGFPAPAQGFSHIP